MAPEPRLGPPQTRVDVPLCHPQEKERLRAEAEAKEKYNRLALFESDLQLLGVSLDEAVELDEKGLRKAPRPPPPRPLPDAPATARQQPNPPSPLRLPIARRAAPRRRAPQAFRDRSRLLHPDVRAQRAAEELEGVPSVYELNAAFEAVRKLL